MTDIFATTETVSRVLSHLTEADLCKRLTDIYSAKLHIELTMSKLYNLVIMKKFIIKRKEPKILLS
jgi:hypothetical protein